MSLFKKKRLAIATTVYWVLLAYIISGLAWWFIALQTQNQQMVSYKLQGLKLDDPKYEVRLNTILQEAQRKTAGYIGEGTTFLILILVGALFVYREFRRQIRLQLQQQHFMMAVTHELKTPIAVAKLNLETMQKHHLDEQMQQKIIRTALQELGRLDTLTNNILISSQLEGGDYVRVKEDLDLSALSTQVTEAFGRRFPGRQWQVDISPELHIQGDPLLIQLLISNLIENAIKYSPKEGYIGVGLRQEGRHILLMVRDAGPGISDEEKKKVFQKFYRTGNEQTRNTKGTGLGLYLCRKIADDHDATIKVSDNSPTGSIFTVSFPFGKNI